MEIAHNKTENTITDTKIIYGTDEERDKIPKFLNRIQEVLVWGLGNAKICVSKKKDGSRQIFISYSIEEK